jgi:hypothetical protein
MKGANFGCCSVICSLSWLQITNERGLQKFIAAKPALGMMAVMK